jgi:hypothetical protein
MVMKDLAESMSHLALGINAKMDEHALGRIGMSRACLHELEDNIYILLWNSRTEPFT